jgi:hypothetical protein
VLEAALVEVQAHDCNPQDNQAELSELVELQERLDEAEAARIAGGRSPRSWWTLVFPLSRGSPRT